MDGEGRISPKETSEEYVSELYLTYGPKLVRMAHSMLHDFHRAEDAVQIVFTSAFRNRTKLANMEGKAVLGYLCTAVRRTVYNLERDNKKYRLADEWDDEENYFGTGDDSYIYESVTKDELVTEIAMLPPTYSEVMMMRFVHENTVDEICQLLEIDAALVRQRIHRGRILLRKIHDSRAI